MDSSSPSFELVELKQAFHMLTSVSEKMEFSYERLKEQAEELKQELCEKNARSQESSGNVVSSFSHR